VIGQLLLLKILQNTSLKLMEVLSRYDQNGTATRDIITDISFDVNFAGGTLILETEPIENLSAPFFETPETYTVTGGAHQFTDHVLNDAFDCYSFGNGVESFIQDTLTGKSFTLGSNQS
jgi:hypothetical protein